MTLQELSQVYLESARKLDGRIGELNALVAQTTEPSQLLKLNIRLCKLKEMRSDARAIGLRLQNYYQEGDCPHEQKNDTL